VAAKSAAARPRRARGSLSREEILEGALELINRDGLSQLSMPVLARHLGAGVTSIYWYFRSKDELQVALAEQVVRQMYSSIPPVERGRSWEGEVISYFVAWRQLLHATPAYLELFLGRSRFIFSHHGIADPITDRLEIELAVFSSAGLTADESMQAYLVCSVFTRGFVLFEQGLMAEQVDAGVDRAYHDVVRQFDARRYPTLAKLTDFETSTRPGDVHFQLGLRSLVDGLKVQLGLASRRPRTRSRR
jgi:AcrR family transcriptional regulator